MNRFTCAAIAFVLCGLTLACGADPAETGAEDPSPATGGAMSGASGGSGGALGDGGGLHLDGSPTADGSKGAGGNGASHDGSIATSADAASTPAKVYMPMTVGNSWVYKVTDLAAGTITMKTQSVTREEPVPEGFAKGKMALRVVTQKGTDMKDMTESWQGVVDGVVVRYLERTYAEKTGKLAETDWWEPYKLRVDESDGHLRAAATWPEMYKESKKLADPNLQVTTLPRTDIWVVEATDAPCTIGEKTWKCLKVRKSGGKEGNKAYYYLEGVGKVREESLVPQFGQNEDLLSYLVK